MMLSMFAPASRFSKMADTGDYILQNPRDGQAWWAERKLHVVIANQSSLHG